MNTGQRSLRLLVEKWLAPTPAMPAHVTRFSRTRPNHRRYVRVETHPTGLLEANGRRADERVAIESQVGHENRRSGAQRFTEAAPRLTSFRFDQLHALQQIEDAEHVARPRPRAELKKAS